MAFIYLVVYEQDLFRRDESHWSGGVLFDDQVRDKLRDRQKAKRKKSIKISNILNGITLAWPMADIIYSWPAYHRFSLTVNLLAMDMQALFTLGVVNLVVMRLSTRDRPLVKECANDATYDNHCRSKSRFSSFYSGHMAMSMASAGLVCSQHTFFTLYKNSYLDWGSCITMLSLSAAVGIYRIKTDHHYLSDVLVGGGVGLLFGLLWSRLFYYKHIEKALTLRPIVLDDGGGVGLTYNF